MSDLQASTRAYSFTCICNHTLFFNFIFYSPLNQPTTSPVPPLNQPTASPVPPLNQPTASPKGPF